MTSPGAELPDDIKSCQALIEQLRTKLHAAAEQMAHLEELLARHQETIADQERTIENLAADNMLLKRALFGSRRERFADDPAQRLLFEATRWTRRRRTTSKSKHPQRRRSGPARDARCARFPTSCRVWSKSTI